MTTKRQMKALKGLRIAVTRALHQAPPLEKLIREYGGLPVSFPCIAIAPPLDPRPLDARLRNLRQFDWLLLTSGNTARALAQRLPIVGVRLDDTRIRVAAVGPKTAAELRRLLSCDAHFMPVESGAQHLARSLPLRETRRLLLPQSQRADASTAQILRARGAEVTIVIAYRTVIGAGGAELPAMISRREIDALTFTSPSAVAFFRQRCPGPGALKLPALCIGPATAAAAIDGGFQLVISPGQPGLRAMISALVDHFAADAGTASET